MTNKEAATILILEQSSWGRNPNLIIDERLYDAFDVAIKALEQEPVLDKIRAEILKCLSALDDIEKSGFNIYLPNEMSGRRLTYKQCLEFIDKYKAESEPQESEEWDNNGWKM